MGKQTRWLTTGWAATGGNKKIIVKSKSVSVAATGSTLGLCIISTRIITRVSTRIITRVSTRIITRVTIFLHRLNPGRVAVQK